MNILATQKLPDAETLLHNLSDQIAPLLQTGTALVGIHSGGALILDRLVDLLAEPIEAHGIAYGMLDISMHRDDYATRGLKAKIKPSTIKFDVNDQHIILIDDVFNTGRTSRAAMNELFDFGRPASITLAILVNRGGRELPIKPQITAYDTIIGKDYQVQLSSHTNGTLMLECTHIHSQKA